MEKKATFGARCFWGVEAAFIEKRGLATCTPRLAGVAGATA